jgi:hypothetical protein
LLNSEFCILNSVIFAVWRTSIDKPVGQRDFAPRLPT